MVNMVKSFQELTHELQSLTLNVFLVNFKNLETSDIRSIILSYKNEMMGGGL